MSWSRVLGHDNLVKAFQRVVERGRLAHAYIFTGPAGIGKRLFALELAKTFFCENQPPGRFEACDQCPGCMQVEAGTHPDFHVLARNAEDLEIQIDPMREFCGYFGLKPARGRGKVAILDDADDLSDVTANCFLKTLEEPPARSLLLLIGTSADLQLATIRSRCQVLPFAPLPPNLVAHIVRTQGVTDEALLTRLVRLSEGSPGQALALADPELWTFRRSFLQGLAKQPLDSVGLAKSFAQFVEEAGKESAVQRRRASQVLRLTVAILRDVLQVSLGGTPSTAEPDEAPALQALANRTTPERLMELVERCLEADDQVGRRVQLVLVLEAILDALGQKLRGARATMRA